MMMMMATHMMVNGGDDDDNDDSAYGGDGECDGDHNGDDGANAKDNKYV